MDTADDLVKPEEEWDLPPVIPRRHPSTTNMSSGSSGHMDLPADSNSEFDSDYPHHPSGHSEDDDDPPDTSLRLKHRRNRKVIESDEEEVIEVHVRPVRCSAYSSCTHR